LGEEGPNLHRILSRQLRKAGATVDSAPASESWHALLERVDQHYRASDVDRYTLERSIEVSGREMQILHEAVSAERSQLAALVRSLPQGVLLLDGSGTVQMTNLALRVMAGRDPSTGIDLSLVDVTGAAVSLEEALSTDEVFLVGSEEQRPVDVDCVVVGDDRVLWTFTDLSERITHRNELRKAQVEAIVAQRAEQARSDFLARMSHELRTPLNAILGYAELLGDDIQDEQSLMDLTRIHDAGAHLLGLINDVLDLSKVDAGRMEARLEITDFDALLANVVEDMRPIVVDHVDIRITGETIGEIITDPTRVRQCLYNLLANAARYTDRGSIEVSVEVVDRCLLIAVKDTGAGIAASDLPNLFDPFEQTKTSRGGTGLGLALVRSLVELLGGRCTVVSQIGVGSTFTLELPYRPFSPVTPLTLLRLGGGR
jgi:signal transduction histidine kinase